MVERNENEDPKRGRTKKRKLSEIAEERRAAYDPTSEWVDKYGAALHMGLGVQGFHKVSRRRRHRDLPPARKDQRGWEWKRADLSAMKEMEQLGLWDKYWKPLRQNAKTVESAWLAMLQLLAEKEAEIQAEADEALSLIKQEGPF